MTSFLKLPTISGRFALVRKAFLLTPLFLSISRSLYISLFFSFTPFYFFFMEVEASTCSSDDFVSLCCLVKVFVSATWADFCFWLLALLDSGFLGKCWMILAFLRLFRCCAFLTCVFLFTLFIVYVLNCFAFRCFCVFGC